jgi:Rrf2 family protein
MQLTTKSRYALRILAEMASQTQSGPVSRAHLAEAQAISADYMAQLFRYLQAAGLVHSVKGPGGGYTLARAATEITVGDIVRAVEGPIALVPCDQASDGPCARAEGCGARRVWQDVGDALSKALDSWSLADVVQQPVE